MIETSRIQNVFNALENTFVFVFIELFSDQAAKLVKTIKRYKLKSSTFKNQIENLKFDDEIRFMTVLVTVLIAKNSNEKLKKAQNFFDDLSFIKSRLLSKEKRKLKRAFRKRRKQMKTLFNAFLKSSKNTSKN